MLGGAGEELRRADVKGTASSPVLPDPLRLAGSPSGPVVVWKQLRAVLVLAHILSMVLLAIPAPVGGTNRAAWKNPTAQMEFATYSRFLGVPPAEFEDKLYSLAMFWMGIREIYLRPVDPYVRITGTDQPWRMFVGPDRFPPRFQVQARIGPTEFVTLYEERSAQFDWREDFFRQERVRSYTYRYAWPEYGYSHHQNCVWLARQIFDERPAATAVRCRFWKQKTPSAEQVQAGAPLEPGRWEQELVIAR